MDRQSERKNLITTTDDSKYKLIDPETGLTILETGISDNLTIQDEYLNLVKNLKSNLAKKNNECETLKIKLDESTRMITTINQELNKCKFTVFEMNQDSMRNKEKSIKLKNLEERHAKLTNDFVVMSEEHEQFKAKMLDQYLAKSNAINNMECLHNNQREELISIKSELDNKTAQLALLDAQMRSLKNDVIIKDEVIFKLKQTIEEARLAHQDIIAKLNRESQFLADQDKPNDEDYDRISSDVSQISQEQPPIDQAQILNSAHEKTLLDKQQ